MLTYSDGFDFGTGFVGAILMYFIIFGILGAVYNLFFGPITTYEVKIEDKEKD